MKKITYVCFSLLIHQLVLALPHNLDSLKQVAETMPDDSLKCEMFLNIVTILYSGEEAKVYGQRALKLAKALNNPKLVGKSYNMLAWSHDLGEMDKKTNFLDSAEIIFNEIKDKNGLGSVYNTKGTMFVNYGSLDEGEALYKKAYEYYLESGNEERQAGILNNWAVALNLMNKPLDAMVKYKKALDFRLKEQPKQPIKIGRLYNGMGESSKLLGNFSQATDYYLESYNYRKRANNIAVAEVFINISAMVNEAIEQGKDTMDIVNRIRTFGVPNSLALLDSALAVPGVAERLGFVYAIMDVRRERHLLDGNYQQAYNILLEQKKIDEENKLSASSLGALADVKTKYEKEQLKTRLLEEEVINKEKENQVNLLLLFLGVVLLVLVIGVLIYQNRIKANRLLLAEAKQEQQIVSMRSMLEGQEKERARIARDLHDGLGNLLSTLKVSVGSLHIDFKNNKTEKMYAKANEIIDEACTEARKIAHEMMPQALKKFGLKKTLEDFILRMDSMHGFDAHFHVYGNEQILDDSTNLMLFRIVQELFNNIVKYAEASDVMLQMTFSDNWLNLTVEDDGKGFEPDKVEPDKGMGLKSIAFRTHYVGGEYEIDSRPGMGTLVSINVPLKKTE